MIDGYYSTAPIGTIPSHSVKLPTAKDRAQDILCALIAQDLAVAHAMKHGDVEWPELLAQIALRMAGEIERSDD